MKRQTGKKREMAGDEKEEEEREGEGRKADEK